MDEQAFERFLKRSGKKPHVVAGLMGQVRQFEAYLARERQKTLETAEALDLQTYVATLEAGKPGAARTRVRGVALYYRFAGNDALASLAASIRAEAVAQARQAFPLREFRGVNPDHMARLAAAGIVNAAQMLEAGRTPEDRQRLATQCGLPVGIILELVKLCDLARIPGLKTIRARLYYDAGADTVDKLAQWEPEALRQMLTEFVARTGFAGIAPLPKEVASTVATAQALPRLVQYE
jgi:hypothetical protein